MLKGFFGRLRPYQESKKVEKIPALISTAESATDYSFPSGHAQSATTFYGAIGFYLRKPIVITFCTILILMVSLSRIGLGVHYPWDVLAGFILGLTIITFYSMLEPRIMEVIRDRTTRELGVYALVFPVGILIFNGVLTMIMKHDWELQNCASYLGLFTGWIWGVLLEQKHINFKINNGQSRIKVYRVLIGLPTLLTIFLIISLPQIFGIEVGFWQIVIDYLSFLYLGILGSFFVPWVFTRFEAKETE